MFDASWLDPPGEISKNSSNTFCRKFYAEQFCTELFLTISQYSRTYEPKTDILVGLKRNSGWHKGKGGRGDFQGIVFLNLRFDHNFLEFSVP